MAKPKADPLLSRGIWCLVVGVFTSWLLGIGLLFILAAVVCGFVGLFRQRAFHSSLLLATSLVLGFVCAHIALVSGIYAFNVYRSSHPADRGHATVPAVTHR